MIAKVRMLFRLTSISLMTAVLALVRWAGAPLALASPRLERRYRRRITQLWGRLMAILMGMRVHVEGKAPDPPFFLVSNHLSYVDTFLLVGLTGGTFISRADVAHWPLAGLVARTGNTIFIDRSRIRDTARVNELIRAELARGGGVILYAEAGTGPGDAVRPFKSSLLEPAAAQTIPVHYCAIRYATRPGALPASTAVVWHAPITFFAHALRLLELPGFDAYVAFGPEPIASEDRKELAARLHREVQRRFVPIP
jgi:1-acyl-sn-glycerol-3-phosphate acyltransferase